MRGVGLGVEVALEDDVEVFGADHTALHGGEHLDVVEAMEVVFFGKFGRHELDDRAEDLFGRFLVQKLKIAFRMVGDIGKFAVVDFVGIGDDERASGLAEDLGEACHACFCRQRGGL